MLQKCFCLFVLLFFSVYGNKVEILDLDIIDYQKILAEDSKTLRTLDLALHKKGIVGVRGVPTFQSKYKQYIKAVRFFNQLPEDLKEKYKPNHDLGETFIGYQSGKEKFQRPNGKWVVDDLKTSYYAFTPENPQNKWPKEVDIKTPFHSLSSLMIHVGKLLMSKIGLFETRSPPKFELSPSIGRMLYYRKSENHDNPQWCGAHFDHGLFTAILPAVYFSDNQQIPEPIEAGLYVRIAKNASFKKILANDPDVMMFQVGEFGQLMTNDNIRATEHYVRKSDSAIERYTLAVFFSPPMDLPVTSTSILTKDRRYGNKKSCTFREWHEATFHQHIHKK